MMNSESTEKPKTVDSKPFLMFSIPSEGPTVRSWMISMGAASAPARISSDSVFVSCGVNDPVIWKRLENSPCIRATEIASPLPRSNRMMAMR